MAWLHLENLTVMVVHNHKKICVPRVCRKAAQAAQKKTRSPRRAQAREASLLQRRALARATRVGVARCPSTRNARPRSGVGPLRGPIGTTILEDDKKIMTYEIKHVVFLSRVAFLPPPCWPPPLSAPPCTSEAPPPRSHKPALSAHLRPLPWGGAGSHKREGRGGGALLGGGPWRGPSLWEGPRMRRASPRVACAPTRRPPPLRSPAGSISAASDAALAAEGGRRFVGAQATLGAAPPPLDSAAWLRARPP